MDIFTKEKRSEVMSKIKSKNTLVERTVFTHLRMKKIYFQKHYSRVPGSPDLALPSKKLAVFVDGEFWHGWNYKALRGRLNPFWRNKIERNIRRDRKNVRRLRMMGWKIMRVWEHRLKKRPEFWLQKVEDFLREE